MKLASGMTQKQMDDTVKGLNELGLSTSAESGFNYALGTQTWTVHVFKKETVAVQGPAYVIIQTDPRDDDDPLYWNKTRGWTDWLNATVFTQNEQERFKLPVDGSAWEQVGGAGDEADTG